MGKNVILATSGILFISRILAADLNLPALYLDVNRPVDARLPI